MLRLTEWLLFLFFCAVAGRAVMLLDESRKRRAWPPRWDWRAWFLGGRNSRDFGSVHVMRRDFTGSAWDKHIASFYVGDAYPLGIVVHYWGLRIWLVGWQVCIWWKFWR